MTLGRGKEVARRAPYKSHLEISSCSQPPSLGDDQTKSAYPETQTDGWKEELLETSLAVQPDNMTEKHRDGEQNPLKRAQLSEEEGNVVSKCEYLALKSPSACKGMEGPAGHHPVTHLTTAVDGVLYADCTRSQDRRDICFEAKVGIDLATSQVSSRHFVKLATFRHEGTTARSTYRRENYPFQADFGGNPETTTITLSAAHEEFARPPIDRQQRRMVLTASKTSSLTLADEK